MVHILIFLHVTSSLLLGTYVILPFIINRLTILSGPALEGFVGLLLAFTRAGHYALILLLLTGGGMIRMLGTMHSLLWMIVVILLFIMIGAVFGMINKRLKKLYTEKKADNCTVEYVGKIKMYSWIAASAIIAVVLIMINPDLLS